MVAIGRLSSTVSALVLSPNPNAKAPRGTENQVMAGRAEKVLEPRRAMFGSIRWRAVQARSFPSPS